MVLFSLVLTFLSPITHSLYGLLDSGSCRLHMHLVTQMYGRGEVEEDAFRPDKSLDRGLTFNRSQRVSCSATHETLTQNQVVYE